MSQTTEEGDAQIILEAKLKSLTEFLSCYEPILSVNLVGFLTENLWNLLPSPINSELLTLSTDTLCLLPVSDLVSSNTTQSSTKDENFHFESARRSSTLHKFIRDFNCHRLKNLQVLTPLTDIPVAKFSIQAVQNNQEEACTAPSDKKPKECVVRPKMNTFMAEKKSHEVETMAGVVAAMAMEANINQVVDIGSGKGYLGQHLALQYSLNVLGIDSSQSNSHGAKVRGQKLRKQWPSKNKKCKDTSENISFSKRSDLNDSSEAVKMSGDGNVSKDVRTQRLMDEEMPTSQDFSNEFQTKCRTKEGDKIDQQEDYKGLPISCSQPSRTISTATKQSNLKDTSQAFIKSEQDNQAIDKGTGTEVCQPWRIAKLDEEVETEFLKKCGAAQSTEDTPLYRPVTAFVDTTTDISALIHANSSGNAEQMHVVLSGLHTCGDLSSSMLRLFIANPSTHILCNVPCCHHILTEEFEQQSAMVQNRSDQVHYGFPMSAYLRSQKTKLGGVARMMACMAAEKVAYEKKLPTDKLFYRAVLQVILKENYTIPSREQKTGKLASKCSTFVEYTRRALKKMGYQEDKLSDEIIQQYYDTYQPEMKKLEAFNQVRTALAPSIEALILLDKLCFLKEQDSVRHAYLVQLFDPIKSPRCHGIIAVK